MLKSNTNIAGVDLPKRSTKALLQETYDIIAATYWIKGDEYKLDELPDQPEKFKSVVVVPNTIDSRSFAPNSTVWNEEGTKGTAKITGVCSIGAIALAEMTLYDVPLMGYDAIRDRDIYVKAAELVTAMEVMSNMACTCIEPTPGAGTITSWNDCGETTREDVLKVFKGTLSSPLIKARKFWGYPNINAYWPTKGEALKVRTLYRKALKDFQQWVLASEYGYVDDVREDWPGCADYPTLIGHMLQANTTEDLDEPMVMLEVKE